jgi:hypothetical protein
MSESEHPCDNGTCNCDGSQDPPERVELVVLEMGLQEFQEHMRCPKCFMEGIQVEWHPNLMIGCDPETPCGIWVQAGLLTPSTTEHLCLRCNRCRYGWPTKTADAG